MISNIKFRKILNDLKRRPEDAAKDLSISKKKINAILSNKSKLDFRIIQKAVNIWPVNYGEFFSFTDDTKYGFKVMRADQSNKSKRIMSRGGNPYYLYKDTLSLSRCVHQTLRLRRHYHDNNIRVHNDLNHLRHCPHLPEYSHV